MLWLHTEGNQIKDSAGRAIRLTGGACSILEWGWSRPDQYTSGHWNEEYVIFFKECGGTSIRLALTCLDMRDSYVALVDQFVEWCRRNNVYVILDMHYGDPDAPDWASDCIKIIENPTTPLNQILTKSAESPIDYPAISWVDWLKFYANRYKNESTVCGICIFNEPCGRIPAGYTAENLFQVWRNASVLAVDAIQSVNPNVLSFVYGMYWGATLKFWNSNPLPQNNVVYSITRYMMYDEDQPYYTHYLNGDYAAGKHAFELLWQSEKIFEMADKYPVNLMEWGSSQKRDLFNVTLEPHFLQWQTDILEIMAPRRIHQHWWTYSGYGRNDGDILTHQDWIEGRLVLSERGLIWQKYLEPLPTPKPLLATFGLAAIGGGIGYVVKPEAPVVPILVGAAVGGTVGYIIDRLLCS